MKQIPFNLLERQYGRYQQEYEAAAIRVLRSGWYVLGQEVAAFEAEFAQRIGSENCIGVNSGMDALSLAIRALEIGEGDEVLVPSNTFIASVLAITENGATPVFVEPDAYYHLDPERLLESLSPQTKAILVVHLYGQTADMGAIMDFAKAHGLYVIEDCAQSHTAAFAGKMSGTFGDIGCFSFYPTKNLGAFGDGGAVVTDSAVLSDKLRKLRNYGSTVKYRHDIEGVNSRLDELQAALLRVNLRHLEETIQERETIAKRYLEGIHNCKIILPCLRENAGHVWHLFVIRCGERDSLAAFLCEHGIEAAIHYPIPPHLAPCYKRLQYKAGAFPVAEEYARTVLSLPLYNGMTDEETAFVIDAVNQF